MYNQSDEESKSILEGIADFMINDGPKASRNLIYRTCVAVLAKPSWNLEANRNGNFLLSGHHGLITSFCTVASWKVVASHKGRCRGPHGRLSCAIVGRMPAAAL